MKHWREKNIVHQHVQHLLEFDKYGASQTSKMGLALYSSYTYNLPTTVYNTTATIAEETSVLVAQN